MHVDVAFREGHLLSAAIDDRSFSFIFLPPWRLCHEHYFRFTTISSILAQIALLYSVQQSRDKEMKDI